LVQECKLFVDLAHGCKIICIEQIHTVDNKAVNRIVVVQNSFLLFVPVILSRD
jgi:hypothetical protein